MSKRISQLNELTTVLNTDILPVVNNGQTKKVTKANLLKEVTQSLTGKAEISHTHDDLYYTEAEINSFLAAKANSSHSHTVSDITNFSAAVNTIISGQKGTANGLATLDANGLIPLSQLPPFEGGGDGGGAGLAIGAIISGGTALRVLYGNNTNQLAQSDKFTFDGSNLFSANINIPQTTATEGYIKQNGVRFIHSFGLANTFIGKNSGNYTTMGDFSVGIGEGSLTNSLSGRGNVGIGAYALTSNTIGQFNTAIGYYSLGNNQTGSNNIGIGSTTLISLMSGDYNIAIGGGALSSYLSGSYNIAIGANSLATNTAGSNNTALGTNSLYASNGSKNTAFGQQSLVYTQTGDDNTAFGYGAMYGTPANANLSRSTAFGSQAGYNLQSGASDNTLFGYMAGANITTGSNNIVIGSGIYAPESTAQNTLTIGNLIYGTGVNGSGTTVSSGKIGIGIANPSETLHVNGTTRSVKMLSDEDIEVQGSSKGIILKSPDGTRRRITINNAGTLNITII